MDAGLYEILTKFGCKDLDVTMKRFTDDEPFFYTTVMELLENKGFEKLRKHLEEKNVKVAFEEAHALKGIIGNCGLTPMYENICSMVEILRVEKSDGLISKYELLLKQREQLKTMLKSYQG